MGDSLKWFWESRTQDSEQIQRYQWLDPRNQNSSVLYFTPSLFHSLFFDGLSLTISSLRLLHIVRESKIPALVFYILKASPIRKEKIEDIRVQGCSLNDPPQISCAVLTAILAGPWGPMIEFTWSCGPDPEAHMIVNFLQNYMTEAGERQPQRKQLGDSLGHGIVCDDPPTAPPPQSEELWREMK